MVKNKDEKKKKIRMRPCVQLPYLNPFFFCFGEFDLQLSKISET